MVIDEEVGRFEIAMADPSQLEIVESLEHLEDEYFADGGREGSFEFSLFFDHEVEAAGDVVHDDGEVALLRVGGRTLLTSLRKYSCM